MRIILTIDDISHILVPDIKKGCTGCSLKELCYKLIDEDSEGFCVPFDIKGKETYQFRLLKNE